jgi:hypothetical protein
MGQFNWKGLQTFTGHFIVQRICMLSTVHKGNVGLCDGDSPYIFKRIGVYIYTTYIRVLTEHWGNMHMEQYYS